MIPQSILILPNGIQFSFPIVMGVLTPAIMKKIVFYNGSSIYLRGFRVLNALFDDLDSMGLAKSAEVVITGTSAGSLATYLHAEYLRTRLPKTARVVALPDAGFFLDHKTVDGVYNFRQQFQGAIGPSLWNATSGTNQACISSYNPEEQWHCFFAQYVYPFISNVPTFVLNSLYDPSQLGGMIYNLGCDPSKAGNCTDQQLAEMQSYRDDMENTLAAVIDNPRDGLFATACYQHEESCQNFDWDGIKVNNTLMVQSFTNWYTQTNLPTTKLIDIRWPNNPTCVLNANHGAC